MRKLVKWGHWAVAATFAVTGAPFLFSVVAIVPRSVQRDPQMGAFTLFWGVILSLPPFACAWGIIKWRRWGWMLAIVDSVVILGGYATVVRNNKALDWGIVLALIYCAMLVWLLLPVVRAEYLRRSQVA